MENNQTASRAAKRFLEDRIRNDWAYPDVPPAWSASDEEVRDAHDFRARYYGDSESSNSSPENATGPYKFDSPESIGDAVAQTQTARRRRRRERLEVEMQRNPGLKIWVERRDLWTGATSVRKYGSRRCRRGTKPVHEASRTPTTNEGTSFDDGRPSSGTAIPDDVDMVPVAPRLLDANPIRASITPRAYSDIFQKIVVSARTPSVPINLADMTKILVQGWKDTDEWPPKVGLVDPLVGRNRGITGTAVNGQQSGFMERHPHFEKRVDSVKKILHLNASHHLPDHTTNKD